MRPKERIPVFLSLVDWETLAERWGIDIDLINNILDQDGKLSEGLKAYWLSNPDLRFGQLLINFEFIPDNVKRWSDEESSILDDQGIARREFVHWGRVYDDNRNPLDNVEWILIKDLKTDHIEAILRDVANHRMNIRKDYKDLFEQELKLRQ